MMSNTSVAELNPDKPSQIGSHVMLRWQIVLLAALLLCGLGLRFFRIESTPIWCDELLSVHLSSGHNFSVDHLPRDVVISHPPDLLTLANAAPWWTVWTSLSGDVHPPLYYVSLRLWRTMFGDSPLALRSLSAVLGTASIFFIFLAGRELAGTAAGLWVAAINVVATQHIYYSQEARMYAMALLWISAVLWIVLRIGRLGLTRRRAAALVLTSLLAMLTLYLSVAPLLACAIYVAFMIRRDARAKSLLAFAIAAGVFAVIWLPFFQRVDVAKADWLSAGAQGHLAESMLRAVMLPLDQFGVTRPSMAFSGYLFAFVYIFPLLAIRRWPAIFLPWLAALLVVGFPLVADVVRSTNMLRWERYTLLLIPTLSLSFVATAIHLLRTYACPLRYALPAALTLWSTLSLVPLYADLSRYDFRAIAVFAERACEASQGRPVFATTWNHKFNSVLLLAAQYYWTAPPKDIVLIESIAELDRLQPESIPENVVVVAGDLPADFTALREFDVVHGSTWQLGVGSVNTLRRKAVAVPDAKESR